MFLDLNNEVGFLEWKRRRWVIYLPIDEFIVCCCVVGFCVLIGSFDVILDDVVVGVCNCGDCVDIWLFLADLPRAIKLSDKPPKFCKYQID